MSIDEPTFSYANGALEDSETLKRRAHESAVRQALASEAKAHHWEHRQPAGAVMGAMGDQRVRTFTREEVLAILKGARSQTSWIGNDERRAGAFDAVLALETLFRTTE